MDDLDTLLKQAMRAGWSVRRTRGNHWCLMAPNGKAKVYTSSTPSDWRGLPNLRAWINRIARSLGTPEI